MNVRRNPGKGFSMSPRGHWWALISLLRDTEYGERGPGQERAKGGECSSEQTAGLIPRPRDLRVGCAQGDVQG